MEPNVTFWKFNMAARPIICMPFDWLKFKYVLLIGHVKKFFCVQNLEIELNLA